MLNNSENETVEIWIKSHMITKLEAYGLVWYVAARHTSIDSLKHGRKGILITIGDEPVLETIPKRDINELFGNGQADVNIHDILSEARKSWNVYHINVTDWSGSRNAVKSQWKQLLGDNFIETQSETGEDVPNLIAGIVIKEYNKTPEVTILNEENLNEETIVKPTIIL